MNRKKSEFLTGIVIGLILAILFSVKAMAADLTPEESELIAKTVQAESGNQDFLGKRLVVATVLNRVDSSEFPNTVEGVLSQKNQFSTYKALSETETTWQDELAVKVEAESRSNEEVMYFRTNYFGYGKPLFKHQDHYFSGIKK